MCQIWVENDAKGPKLMPKPPKAAKILGHRGHICRRWQAEEALIKAEHSVSFDQDGHFVKQLGLRPDERGSK